MIQTRASNNEVFFTKTCAKKTWIRVKLLRGGGAMSLKGFTIYALVFVVVGSVQNVARVVYRVGRRTPPRYESSLDARRCIIRDEQLCVCVCGTVAFQVYHNTMF